ncbi:MAG TPA: tetratricopeptide repeat protein [Sandaracinaceae bacterium LLY-WYZ-13_1]|nr:tetratricopeptide repeat protein [Sandaracinaceae bacterium LLY-WYZ-13_1]
MQVACPSCSSEYNVPESHLPAKGLKMRCPKCQARFRVHPDGRVDPPEPAGGAAKEPAVPKPKAFPKPGAAAAGDADLPAPKAPGAPKKPLAPPVPDADLPAPKAPAAKGPPKPKVPAPPRPGKRPLAPPVPDDLDLDLPAPKGAVPRPSAAKPAPADDLELDLPAPKVPSPPKPKKRPLAPPVPPGAGAAGDDLDVDLPAPRGAKATPPAGDLDADLPAPRGGAAATSGVDDAFDLDLPAPRAGASSPAAGDDFGDLDLPAPRAGGSSGEGALDELDLPAPRSQGGSPDGLDDLDLPAPRSAGSDFDLDLPTPAASDPKPALADDTRTPFDDLDLPAAQGDVELPQPKTRSVIEQADEAFGDLDLPMPKTATPSGDPGFGDLDLPMPKEGSDLPAPKSDFPDLPEPSGGGFGDLDLPTPRSDLPAPKGDAFGDLDIAPEERADLPMAAGDADLPVAREDDDLALPEPRQVAPAAPDEDLRDREGRVGVGGTAFGELDLGEGEGAGLDVDDMEFADIPQEGAAEAPPGAPEDSLPPPRVAAQPKRERRAAAPEKKGKAVWVAAVVLLLLVGAGAALGLTPYGLFGIYYFDRFLPGAGDPARVRQVIEAAEEQAASDRWVDLRRSLVTLGEARHDAGLNRALLARSLVHESLYQVRFGDGFGSGSRASAIQTRLDERGAEGPEYALARAARALATDRLGPAGAAVRQARAHDASDPYVDLVAGELALAQDDPEGALEAFTRAAEHGAGARGLWGVARVRLAGDDEAAAHEAVDAVLEASPHHGEAMVEKARMRLADGEADEAIALAERAIGRRAVDGERLRSAPRARALGWTLIGRVREDRGRLTRALEAYDAALAADDGYVPALLGAGRVLLGDRPADALARFESVLQTPAAAERTMPSGRTAHQEAQLGAARAMLSLDRVQEANTVLERLAAERDSDPEVLLWVGHAAEALDPPSHDSAEQNYRAAIQAAPERFAPYLALAELFLETERGSAAGAVLEQAASRVPETAEMRRQLGAFELRRNDVEAAIEELQRALELDADLPPALFSLGVAYRRAGRLEDAERAFEQLAEADPGHPGLALERGRLFEARGESERAVTAYRSALEEQPDDMDLLLRLGAAQVGAEQIDDAEATLERVRQARPNSPEAHHFFGRVAFARGRYAEALTHFRQAVRLDPARGEFHLYVGWAALENQQLGEALRRVDEALERDPSLGDAYWVRGEVKLRQGRPADALEDLQRAVELKPSRYAAHAAMGEAYDQLGRLPDAIASYERAVEHVDDEGQWWYRLGRLRMDRGDRDAAQQALARATLLGDAETPVSGWLADAHRLQGDALRLGGQRADAVQHYRRYLELAPASAIDRPDVRELLMDMGEVPPE